MELWLKQSARNTCVCMCASFVPLKRPTTPDRSIPLSNDTGPFCFLENFAYNTTYAAHLPTVPHVKRNGFSAESEILSVREKTTAAATDRYEGTYLFHLFLYWTHKSINRNVERKRLSNSWIHLKILFIAWTGCLCHNFSLCSLFSSPFSFNAVAKKTQSEETQRGWQKEVVLRCASGRWEHTPKKTTQNHTMDAAPCTWAAICAMP